MRSLAALFLVGLLDGNAFAQPPAAEDEEPFSQEEPPLEADLVFDARFAYTDEARGFLDGGQGKTRYGGDESGDERALARIAQLSFAADARFFEGLGAHLHLNFDAEPDRGSAADRVDLVEAFLRYRFGVWGENQARGKLGLFFPPLSLEHPGPAWTTLYTITPSFINAWVGEEIRSLGAEISFARTGIENEASFTAAAFGWNDPAPAFSPFADGLPMTANRALPIRFPFRRFPPSAAEESSRARRLSPSQSGRSTIASGTTPRLPGTTTGGFW